MRGRTGRERAVGLLEGGDRRVELAWNPGMVWQPPLDRVEGQCHPPVDVIDLQENRETRCFRQRTRDEGLPPVERGGFGVELFADGLDEQGATRTLEPGRRARREPAVQIARLGGF